MVFGLWDLSQCPGWRGFGFPYMNQCRLTSSSYQNSAYEWLLIQRHPALLPSVQQVPHAML